MKQKRSRFPRHRWIRVGKRVQTRDGHTAYIEAVDVNGVRVSNAGWSCTWHWPVVFRERAGMGPLVNIWRPA